MLAYLKSVVIFIGLLLSPNIKAQKSHLISTNDGVIHYKTIGKGKPIVIINGGPGMNSDGFENFAAQLSKEGFLCIIYDQRGTGKSEMKKLDQITITMKNMVEDLEVLRRHLQIKKWTVIGQSFGGLLATQYARTYPKFVDKLVFSNSGGLNLDFLNYVGQRIENNLSQQERDSLQYYTQQLSQEPEHKLYLRRRALQLASAYVYQKEHVPIIAERLLQVNLPINQLVYTDLQKNKFDFIGKFNNFKKPVLIFQGLNDIISIETAQAINATFSESKLVELDKCGHYPWLDRPEVFWSEINKFLKGK